jgi:hypothetical protein
MKQVQPMDQKRDRTHVDRKPSRRFERPTAAAARKHSVPEDFRLIAKGVMVIGGKRPTDFISPSGGGLSRTGGAKSIGLPGGRGASRKRLQNFEAGGSLRILQIPNGAMHQ